MIYKTTAVSTLSVTQYAEVLFATSLQESDNPGPTQLRTAVQRAWVAGGANCDRFAANLAQEAGDHPEETARRMRWAVATASRALPAALALAG
jgi:hypothetical protein